MRATVTRVAKIGGVLVVEIEELRWFQYTYDTHLNGLLCGELEQAIYMLWRTAWVERCYRDLDEQLIAMAHRVGVEYTVTRTSNPIETLGE